MRSEIVETTSGAVRGVVENDSVVFRGIPYAAPPFGDRLWKLPEPPTPWEGVRDCSEFGPICPQPSMGGGVISLSDAEEQGEDCLRLNVWTPLDGGDGLPVMVWIHGGAYMFGSGSGPGNHGHTFSRDGVVFVSLNYRLGAMGFLHTGALRSDCDAGSGNYGIADQVAALRWVRDNIAAFGGNPDNVTVFGVSAGGNYVQALSACPQANGLFHRGISESAGGTVLWGIPPHCAAAVAEVFFEMLDEGRAEQVDLTSLTAQELLDAQAALLEAITTGKYDERFGDLSVPFYPVSGTDHQPLSANDAHDAGRTSHVDLIIGMNSHEHSLFAMMAELGGPSAAWPRSFRDWSWKDDVTAVYRATEPDASDERIEWTVYGDRGYRVPNLRAAEGRARNGATTWWYEFIWESPAFDGRLGAAHGLEWSFVFDDTDAPMAQFMTGGVAPRSLVDTMHQTWIAFARDGVPRSKGLPEWPQFDLAERACAVFDEESRVERDWHRERRLAWEGRDVGHQFPEEG